jgi:hypothetical protein
VLRLGCLGSWWGRAGELFASAVAVDIVGLAAEKVLTHTYDSTFESCSHGAHLVVVLPTNRFHARTIAGQPELASLPSGA